MSDFNLLVEKLTSGDSYEFRNKFDRVYATFSYHYNLRLLLVVWTGFVTPADIIVVANRMIDLAAVIPLRCVVNDNKTVEGPWYDAVEWIVFDWRPRAVASGIKRMAQILSTDSYAALSGKEMLENLSQIGNELQVQSFKSVDEAKEWMLELIERGDEPS